MTFLTDLFNYSASGLPIGRIGAGLVIILFSFLARKSVISAFRRGKKKGKKLFITDILSELSRPAGNLVMLLGFAIGVAFFGLGESISLWVGRIINLAVTGCFVWLFFKGVDVLSGQMGHLASTTESRLDDQLVPVLQKLVKVIIIALAIVFYLQLLGYPVTGIIAGLGIGGIALALAAQDSLSGIFASVTIFLDKPFMVGDFVKVAGTTGTVEEIGLRSTRIRTPGKTLVTIPNKEIVDTEIDNLSQRPMRRTEFSVGLTYDTSADQMEKLLVSLREYLRSNSDVDDQMVLVNFTEFGDWSLNIDMKFFLKTTNYEKYLGMRERINLDIMSMVADHGLSMAFPTSTIVMENT
jgi:MscS family membrane protein